MACKPETVAYDAILIAGGGVRDGGELPPWIRRRFDRAMELHSGEHLIALSGGTVHRPPPLDSAGFPILESIAGARYLMKRGVLASKILVETSSYDTIGNALFARLIHTDPRGFRRILMITSEFHMERTVEIFRWVFAASPDHGYDLHFEATENTGIAAADLEARRPQEQSRISDLQPLKERLRTLPDIHQWLFTEHAAYAPGQKPARHSDPLQTLY